MTKKSDAIARIREVLEFAELKFGAGLFVDDENDRRIQDVLAVQGVQAPSALLEYWRLAGASQLRSKGSPPDGIWRSFSRHGGFPTHESLNSRLIAIETALSAGYDWTIFRFAEPVVTFKYTPGGSAVYWVEFDSDDEDASHDPPVWTLSERPGDTPRLVSDRFSEHIRGAVEAALKR